MNKTYRSVWNVSTQTWVAVPETARCRAKARSKGRVATAVGVISVVGAAAASSDAFAVVGAPGLELCYNGTALGAVVNGGCTLGGVFGPGSTENAFGLFTTWGLSWPNQPAYVVGLQTGQLYLQGLAGITMQDAVSMSNNQIHDLAAGTAATDAVNVSQLGDATEYFHANSVLPDSQPTGTDSVAIGGNAVSSASNSVALGANATTTADLTAAAYNPGTATLSGTTPVGEVSIGSSGNERRLTNVAAGSLPTDAVNVSQLQSEDAKVNTQGSSIANAIGGGSTYDPTTGTLSNPSFVVGGTTQTTIAGALTNLDGRVTQNTSNISNLTDELNAGTIGLVQQATPTSTITVAPRTAGTLVDFAGTAGPRTLTGVAAAAVNPTSVDAVNGSQLYATGESVANALGGGSTVGPDGTVSTPAYVMDGGTTVNGVGAALTNLDGRVAGNTTDLSNLTNELNSGSIGLVQQASPTAPVTVAATTGGTAVDFTGTAGSRKLTGVAAGGINATSVDAVNGSQLYATGQSVASALGGGSTVNPDGTVSTPSYVVDGGTTYNNVGGALTNLDGRVTQNTSDLSNLTNELNSGSIGLVQQATPTGTVTVGAATGGTVVDFTGTSGARKLTGVAVGDVNPTSVDAINGSQLYATSQSTANALGGGSTVNPDGTVSAPTYVIDGGATVSSVGAALTNLDGRVTQNTSDIGNLNTDVSNLSSALNNLSSGNAIKYSHTNSTLADSQATGTDSTAIGGAAVASGSQAVALGSNATASAANSVALGAGSVADRANSVSVGSVGNERQITNVAAGTQGTDAVNVNQLNQSVAAAVGDLPAGMSGKQYTDQQISMVQQGVSDLARNAYSGIAAATALTMIPDIDQGTTLGIGVGGGTYKGYEAAALGAIARVTQGLKIKVGAGYSTAGVTAGVGALFQW